MGIWAESTEMSKLKINLKLFLGQSTWGCQHAMMAPSSLKTTRSSLYPETSPRKSPFGAFTSLTFSSSITLNFLGALKTLAEARAVVENDLEAATPLASVYIASENIRKVTPLVCEIKQQK